MKDAAHSARTGLSDSACRHLAMLSLHDLARARASAVHFRHGPLGVAQSSLADTYTMAGAPLGRAPISRSWQAGQLGASTVLGTRRLRPAASAIGKATGFLSQTRAVRQRVLIWRPQQTASAQAWCARAWRTCLPRCPPPRPTSPAPKPHPWQAPSAHADVSAILGISACISASFARAFLGKSSAQHPRPRASQCFGKRASRRGNKRRTATNVSRQRRLGRARIILASLANAFSAFRQTRSCRRPRQTSRDFS